MAKALYREYRPQKFSDVLGQERVVNVLKNQVKSGQISHAYLFAGERGCGKTTCAKIFAKAINCLNPIDSSPCGKCENCKAIEEESTMDVVEMDAASNRRIDDIRNLKETVVYPPNNLKYKVYIIDEAHMITREAFNALLKIMEEPPSHLVFILATTEIEKIPKTILSRVQKFEFNKIGRDDIIKQIDIILNDRKVSMEDEAKDLIVKKAKGAMRDALSILDQVLSIDKDNFLLQDVENILGVVDFDSLDKLVDNIISYNQKDSLEILFKLKENGKDDRDILDGLVGYLRDIMVYKISLNEKYVDNLDYIDLIKEKTEQISSEKIVSYLEILNDYSNRMKVSENSSLLMEMAILRLINLKDEENILSRIEKLERNQDNDQVDIINKLVDQKFKNINLDKFLENSKRDFEKKDTYEQKPVEKEVSKRQELDQKTLPEEQAPIKVVENVEEDIEDKNPNESSNNSYIMDKKEEEIFISELLNSSSPILRAQIKAEGFNYDIIGDNFTIYYKNNIYYQFLDETKSKMKEILKSLLGKDFDVKVSSIDKKKSSINNNIRGSKKDSSDDVIEKLVEVFDNDLIIEE
ncbi:DNA polymerase III subunit gamma/tau [Anaerococcus hydrogenalis]|uniref:DNA-directed DNA polymerase n=1 Tax=Anaerococcus hydrogenalis TaxID=33029 RepID=A0A2N6ULI1_9FIRM|nr:DNA polymerase III subunit gamma/tau [Anaerococcus hydrogenalis]MDK7694667.1 DNA polymerase III subunit gamma/tau [Anaerococcus hydrogenalis]MDK7696445.1 DNA polymerase III subunit gamma/tau [Anaerococcus hydrogenalis]MDK7707694.1 DNA polymerase III subunit gamma/tau [Anaerococcus hydrogenalis]PMC82718.1 DNA polymerase III subunit gamma/tau [Anaerococcus hydrogenalis]